MNDNPDPSPSHPHLMNEFVTAILQDRAPLVDVVMALNLTVSGIVRTSRP